MSKDILGRLAPEDKKKVKREELIRMAGLDNVTLHTLRHAHASILIYQGVDIKTISRRLGHEDVAFTLQVYGHLLPGQDEKAAAAIDTFHDNL